MKFGFRWTVLLLLIQSLACTHGSRLVEAPLPVDPSVRKTELHPPERVSALGKKWVVSTQGEATTRIAARVLREGGNLVDAAIAASFAISVERPHSTGIGGGGFLIHRDGKSGKIRVFDFRERAPSAAHARLFLDSKGEVIESLSRVGGKAVAVPGLVRGLREVHRKLGRTPWKKLVLPAAELAREGFPIYPALARAIREEKDDLARFKESRLTFLRGDGSPKREGEPLVQAALSLTLKTLARNPEDFYTGKIARRIVKSVRSAGGILTLQDLARYAVKEREPLRAEWKGLEVVSMPPPSSGGIHVIQILKMLEEDELKAPGALHPVTIHRVASAMQQAFADRARYLGDPDFIPVPVKGLIDSSYLRALRGRFLDRARRSDEVRAGVPVPLGDGHSETTHFSLMDAEGNVVVSTQTINDYFGSKVTAEGTGVVMNNEMDDFSAKIGASNLFGATSSSEANAVAPGKTPLSSMSPTLLLKDGVPVLALGAPGGTRIITSVALTILNRVVHGMGLYEAVSTTRFHQQWSPDELLIENQALEPGILSELGRLGWRIRRVPPQSNVMAVARTEDGSLIGVSDPRDAGTSAAE